MEFILGVILEHAVELVAALILLLIPSPAGVLKKVLIFIRDVLNKILKKK